MTLALSQSTTWFSRLQWSVMANFELTFSAFSFSALVCLLLVFLCILFDVLFSGWILSLGCTWSCCNFVCGLTGVLILYFFMAFCICSVTPLIYISATIPLFSVVHVCFFSPFLHFLSFLPAVILYLFPIVDTGMFWLFCMCCSSFVLSSSLVIIVACSYSVLITDILCVVGCSEVHNKYLSVCKSFLCTSPLPVWLIFKSRNTILFFSSLCMNLILPGQGDHASAITAYKRHITHRHPVTLLRKMESSPS